MPSVKQGRIKYNFLSLWYDSIWDWTLVFRAIGEHFNPKKHTQSKISLKKENWKKYIPL